MSVQKYDSVNKIKMLIAGGTLWADCPLGTINAFGGATAPEGWLLCQGQAISRTEYADLFAVIGTNFGSGDGSTTFNLPDLRGEFLRGAGTNSHTTQGNGGSVGTHQDATVINPYYNAAGGSSEFLTASSDGYNITNFDKGSSATGFGTVFNGGSGQTKTVQVYSIRPTNTSVNYIMKVKQAPVPEDLKIALNKILDDKDMLVWG